MKASQYFTVPIPGKIDERASELVIIWEGGRPQPDAVRQWFEQRLDTIEKGLGFARSDINGHNTFLINEVPGWVKAQRQIRLTGMGGASHDQCPV
jgi:hypothetical protein